VGAITYREDGEQTMVRTNPYLAIAAMAAQANAVEFQRTTADAWQAYVTVDWAGRVKRAEIVVAPLVERGTQSLPDGLIHDWIVAVFIASATIESLLNVVHDYDRYKDIYKPVVTDSRSLEAGGDEQEFAMVWNKHVMFLNAATRAGTSLRTWQLVLTTGTES
jgi:hypothetical protein